jgi:hypothetical protein
LKGGKRTRVSLEGRRRDHIAHNTFIPEIEKAANDFVVYLNPSSFYSKFIHLKVRS